jgi:hypothetical protein
MLKAEFYVVYGYAFMGPCYNYGLSNLVFLYGIKV